MDHTSSVVPVLNPTISLSYHPNVPDLIINQSGIDEQTSEMPNISDFMVYSLIVLLFCSQKLVNCTNERKQDGAPYEAQHCQQKVIH